MRLVLAATFAAAVSFTVLGQERPNFSGRWVQISPAGGSAQLVKHDATTLAIQHGSEGADHSVSYKLDGSETRNTIPSHGSQIVSVARTEWIGSTVRITQSTAYPDGRKLQSTQLWWVDQQGRLVVELAETMQGKPTTNVTIISRKDNQPPDSK